MEKGLTKQQEQMVLEARWSYLHQLEGEFREWAILSEEEQKRMNSVLRAVNKYINYLETIDTEDLDN